MTAYVEKIRKCRECTSGRRCNGSECNRCWGDGFIVDLVEAPTVTAPMLLALALVAGWVLRVVGAAALVTLVVFACVLLGGGCL